MGVTVCPRTCEHAVESIVDSERFQRFVAGNITCNQPIHVWWLAGALVQQQYEAQG